MAVKLSNVLIAFLIFAGLVTLYIDIFAGITDSYDLTPTDTQDGMSVMEKMQNVGVISAVNQTVTSFYILLSPSSPFDLIGGFLGLGVGVLRTASSLPSYPLEIFGIVTQFYYIPPILATIINLIALVLFGIIIFNVLTGSNN